MPDSLKDKEIVLAGGSGGIGAGVAAQLLDEGAPLVIGYRADELPAFYTPRTEIELEHRVDTAAELAKIVRIHWTDLAGGGVLVANPIPAEAALDTAMIDRAIQTALGDAETRGITGKRLTPYLLQRLAAATA